MVPVTRDRLAILLVDTRAASVRRLGDTLRREGHRVIEAPSFDDAKHALAMHEPDVLISSLRLAAFNGLHLVHLGRLVNPELDAIILSSERDAALHDEVHQVGATLLIEPLHTPTLLDILDQRRAMLARHSVVVTVPVERRRAERRQTPSLGHTPERRVADRRAPQGAFDQILDVVRLNRSV